MVELWEFTIQGIQLNYDFSDQDCQLDDQLEDAILEEEKYEFEPGSGELEADELTIEEFSDVEDYEYYYGHGQNVFSRQKCKIYIFDSFLIPWKREFARFLESPDYENDDTECFLRI